jgi:RNA polymerase sigma-70 factor (ECF subfamily)
MTLVAPGPAQSDPVAPLDLEPRLHRLLRLSSHGNQPAFGAFYDATAPRVYGLALSMGLDVELAERVTQEVFVHAWRQSARYRPTDGEPLAWVLSITHRRSARLLRALRT